MPETEAQVLDKPADPSIRELIALEVSKALREQGIIPKPTKDEDDEDGE